MTANVLSKINLVHIVSEHVETLREQDNVAQSRADALLFYAVPAVVVAVTAWAGMRLGDATIGVLVTALAVLVGLLFNLLVLLHTLDFPQRGAPHDGRVNRLRHELHANIAYAILVSITSLIPLVIAVNAQSGGLLRSTLSHVGLYLVVHFVLTLGMVLKRMDIMLRLRLPDVP